MAFSLSLIVLSLFLLELGCCLTDRSIRFEDNNATACSHPHWLQCDNAWRNNALPCGSTICQVGCAMSSAAMCVGGGWNPGKLNDWLKGHGGYQGCNLVWSAVNSLGPKYQQQSSFSLASMAAMANDCSYCLIANVKDGQHWVLLTGYNGNGWFSVNDPANFQQQYSYDQIYNHLASVYKR